MASVGARDGSDIEGGGGQHEREGGHRSEGLQQVPQNSPWGRRDRREAARKVSRSQSTLEIELI